MDFAYEGESFEPTIEPTRAECAAPEITSVVDSVDVPDKAAAPVDCEKAIALFRYLLDEPAWPPEPESSERDNENAQLDSVASSGSESQPDRRRRRRDEGADREPASAAKPSR